MNIIETTTNREYISFNLKNGVLMYKPDKRLTYTELYYLRDIDDYILNSEETKDLSYFTSCFMDVIGKSWWSSADSNYTRDEILEALKNDLNKDLYEDLIKLLWCIIPFDHFYYGKASLMLNSILIALELTDSEINKKCKMEYKLSTKESIHPVLYEY